jgi:hypothetical protein
MVAVVAAHESELRMSADGGKARLTEHEVVDDRHGEAAVEQRRNQDAAEIAGAAGDENVSL